MYIMFDKYNMKELKYLIKTYKAHHTITNYSKMNKKSLVEELTKFFDIVDGVIYTKPEANAQKMVNNFNSIHNLPTMQYQGKNDAEKELIKAKYKNASDNKHLKKLYDLDKIDKLKSATFNIKKANTFDKAFYKSLSSEDKLSYIHYNISKTFVKCNVDDLKDGDIFVTSGLPSSNLEDSNRKLWIYRIDKISNKIVKVHELLPNEKFALSKNRWAYLYNVDNLIYDEGRFTTKQLKRTEMFENYLYKVKQGVQQFIIAV